VVSNNRAEKKFPRAASQQLLHRSSTGFPHYN
jgi:hypothetical protein